jgi:hypothetical protein
MNIEEKYSKKKEKNNITLKEFKEYKKILKKREEKKIY